ncbi:right-handed parallel beta-helix repeat-containing protein [Patescibacteria group bacterium]|nr:right-handed parallel beta-helix repeat-containing protein [Patescibacteria group bacterium]MBU0777307.1 right-handed parallel beta-helix repeat-containing protein [Patescibacteria group bacterium]MBU0846113.1 right-handed parallel beta-helix repeat-containing protein [Patescibacteria group bacterium]MBU0923166.1 right-handed parallel beta-helix repeat-containing protein [Patescibacteria group bacterium]MBU1066881.1 right-handed parallel beta-helix repeat-containing protein [Patescibacteria 
MAIRVNPYVSPRIIEVQAPLTEISIQDLTDQIKDWEDEPADLAFPILIRTYGKQPLGGGSFVGITAVLQNAKISFEARDGLDTPPEVLCTISGGNLVAVDDVGASMNPIHPTAYTQVVIAQSTSPSIITPPEDLNMLYLIESLRGTGKSLGSIFYWDPEGGSDTNDGSQPSEAVQTFAAAQALTTAGAGDIIFALSTHSSGITTTSEKLSITTAGLKVRGPGYRLQLIPSATGSPTVNISANSAEFEGFYIETKSGGTDNGITATGNNVVIKDCWVNSATGNGIDISSTSRTEINTCVIEESVGYGINVGATTSLSTIRKCIISGNSEGVYIAGASITDNILENNIIYNNTTSGIEIGNGVVRTGIRLHHTFAANNPNITDDGTGTYQDTSGTIEQGDIDNIVSGVWDEVISATAHAGAGSAGKTLRDAKTKATLASLK